MSFKVRQANAASVAARYYAETIVDIFHPACFYALPPSPLNIMLLADNASLVEDIHLWAVEALLVGY